MPHFRRQCKIAALSTCIHKDKGLEDVSDSSNNTSAAAGGMPSDISAVISRLYVYPVKSCAGVQVQDVILTETGLEFDRAWMVVDDKGHFLTQRELPRMALIKPQLRHSDMVLRAPGMLALHIALDEVPAYDMGAIAAQWFTDFLGQPARLVRFDPEHKRVCNMQWTDGVEALNQFSDGYPLLVISEASLAQFNEKLVAAGSAPVGMERFRPNIVLGDAPGGQELAPHDEDRIDQLQIATEQGVVELKPVKPCPRCPIPNIDPATATSSPEVGDMLQSYRQDARVNGALTFGMNVIVLAGVDHQLKVGQPAGASYLFE
jgi:uncharacterized protein YcbX